MFIHSDEILLDRAERLTGLAHKPHANADFVGRIEDEFLDPLGGLSGALSQLADSLRNEGKALTGFASACSLDTCIQRQEIGLEGNLVDKTDDV